MNTFFTELPLLMGAPAGGDGAAGGGAGSLVTTFITFGLVFVIFYFLIIRPQNKKQKEAKRMLEALKKGDKVVTIGGIRGTIQSLRDDLVVLKVDANTKMEFSRSAISTVLEQKSSPKQSVEDSDQADKKAAGASDATAEGAAESEDAESDD